MAIIRRQAEGEGEATEGETSGVTTSEDAAYVAYKAQRKLLMKMNDNNNNRRKKV